MDKKPWFKSQTILSLIGVAVGAFAPKYIAVIPPIVGQAIELAGLISAAFGRSKPNIKEVTYFSQPEE